MDGQRFDALTKSLGGTSRRRALKLLAGGAFGGALAKLGLAETAAQGVGTAARGLEGQRCQRTRDCQDGLRCCNGRCRNVVVDENNCGTCGSTCARNEVCRNGGCFRSCLSAEPRVCKDTGCGEPLCGCNSTETGTGVCASVRGSCADAVACRDNGDCSLGLVCVNSGCCDGKPRICQRPCGTATVGTTTASGPYNGPTLLDG